MFLSQENRRHWLCVFCLLVQYVLHIRSSFRQHSLLPFPNANFLTAYRSLLSTCPCLFHLPVRTVSYSSRPLYMGPSDSLVLNPMLIIQWFFSPLISEHLIRSFRFSAFPLDTSKCYNLVPRPFPHPHIYSFPQPHNLISISAFSKGSDDLMM